MTETTVKSVETGRLDGVNQRTAWLHHIREGELAVCIRMLPPGAGQRLLDFGAGDGFTSRLLNSRGFEVTSVDVEPRRPRQWPVLRVDEPVLPFADRSFDIIFSSNVLEHVLSRDATLLELQRVLKPQGWMLATLPSPAWRLSASIEAPVRFLVRRRIMRAPLYKEPEAGKGSGAARRGRGIRRALAYPLRPHGSFPSALHELVTFSPPWWRAEFRRCDFDVKCVRSLPYLYGTYLFPWKALRLRRLLAEIGLPAGYAYLLRPASPYGYS